VVKLLYLRARRIVRCIKYSQYLHTPSTRMIGKLALLALLLVAFSEAATRVRLNNYCRANFMAVSVMDGKEQTPFCKLKSGFSCYKDFSSVNTLAIYTEFNSKL
jgi:hypothetical protein